MPQQFFDAEGCGRHCRPVIHSKGVWKVLQRNVWMPEMKNYFSIVWNLEFCNEDIGNSSWKIWLVWRFLERNYKVEIDLGKIVLERERKPQITGCCWCCAYLSGYGINHEEDWSVPDGFGKYCGGAEPLDKASTETLLWWTCTCEIHTCWV